MSNEMKQNATALMKELHSIKYQLNDEYANYNKPESLIARLQELAPNNNYGYIYACFSQMKQIKNINNRINLFDTGLEKLRVAIDDLVRYR